MLRLTKKADYGLMALKFLAEHPEALVSELRVALCNGANVTVVRKVW